MKKIHSYLITLVCSCMLLFVSTATYANHLVGMDLFYTHITGNTYKVTLIAYADCGSAGSSSAFATLPTNTPKVHVYNGSSFTTTLALSIEPPSAGVEITPVCARDLLLTQCTNLSYTIPGIKKFVYSAVYTLPGTSTAWSFLFAGDMGGSTAGRAISITNISSTPVTAIQLEATLNNSAAPNTSPVLSVIPTPFFCLNNIDNYNPGAIDPNGDALNFKLVSGIAGTSPSTTRGGPVTYLGTYSGTAPLSTSSFSFDNLTGQITFYPNIMQRNLVVYTIEERRGGVLVGTCQREMTFLVLTCTNVAASGGLTGATNSVIDDSTHLHACEGTGAISVNIDPTEPTKANNITVTSSGLPTGSSFIVTGNGTNAPHCVFSWTTTGITPGTYTFFVTYTDDNCPLAGITTLAYTITILPSPTISSSLISAANCYQRAAVSLIPGGSGSPWTIKIADGLGFVIRTLTSVTGTTTDSLVPGSYTATISSAATTCTAATSISITGPAAVTATGSFTNPSYCGATDGTIKLSGLTPGDIDTVAYFYGGAWQPARAIKVLGDGTITITGLSNGVYSPVTSTYGRYCDIVPVGPFNLVTPPFIARALSSVAPSYCGICDGKISILGLRPGQSDTVTYTLGGVAQTPVIMVVPSDSTITITGLCVGTYDNFYVKTGNCISNKLGPVTLTGPPFTMSYVSGTNPDYCGICNGTIVLHGLHPGLIDTIKYTLGGIPQTSVVRFIGPDSLATITGLCGGVYDNFYAKNGTSCLSNKLGPIVLTTPTFTMRALSSTNPDYCGICNGTITLYGLHPGNLDTITYIKDGAPQTPIIRLIGSDSTVVISGLCLGVYSSFIARTGGVCVSNTLGPVTLTVPPFTMRDISYTEPDYCGICNGTITLYGLHPGNRDTINYTMDGMPQFPVIRLIGSDSTVVITGLCAGVYDNFVATTGGICMSNKLGPVTLTVPLFTARSVTFTNPDYCGVCNGTITIHGLHPGNTDTINYTKDGSPQPAVSRLIGSDSTLVLTGLCAGVYDNIIATTGGVCVSNTLGPVVLTVPQFTMRAISHTNPDFCGICNGTITLYGLHPGQTDTINYTKDGVAQARIIRLIGADSTIKITGLCAGIYDHFVANTGGVCVSNILGPVSLVVPPFTMRAITHTNPDFCGICNGTITLYGLHPGQIDSLYYTKDGIPQGPFIQVIGADSTIKMTGLCAGFYDNFIAKTGGVCATNSLGPAALVVPPFTMSRISYINPTKCGFCDGSIKLYGLHPGQTDTIYYSLNGVPQTPVSRVIGPDSTVTLTDVCEGVYSGFIARTGGVCVSNTLGPVTLAAPPIKASFTYDIHKTCKVDTVYFTNTSSPSSELTFLWEFGDGKSTTMVNPYVIYTKPGTPKIKLTVTNSKCFDSVIEYLNIDNLISGGFTASPDSFLCQDKEVVFTNQSEGTRLSYLWNFGDGSRSVITADAKHTFDKTGKYKVSMIVANYVPCYDTVVKLLEVDSLGGAGVIATDTVLCSGHEVTFRGIYTRSGLENITWTLPDGTTIEDTSIVVYPFSKAGTFPVSFRANYRSCPDTGASKSVLIFGYPALSLGNDTSICLGSAAISLADNINNNNQRARWLWNTGETTSSINITKPGVYDVTVTIYGCPTSDTVIVSNDCYMSLPNVFSPNGDGTNDYFFPRGLLSRGLTSFKMDIFNRWGQKIFETTAIDGRGWDGSFNGTQQPEGVFIYRIEATFKDGQIEKHQGNVTLIR